MSTVKTVRVRLGLTQQALADGIGCTQGNVWHYEQGQTVPPDMARTLIAFAASRGLEIGFDHIYGTADIPELQTLPKTEQGVANA